MPAPIRVLHILEDHDQLGGAEEVVTTLVTAQQAGGIVCPEVALVSPNRLAKHLAGRNIPVHSLGNEAAVRPALAAQLAQLVIDRKISIVQSHLLKMNSLNALAAGRHPARTVGTCHGLLAHELTLRSRCYGFWAGRKLDRTVCVSHALARRFARAYAVPAKKIAAIPNGFDPARQRAVTTDDIAAFRERHAINPNDTVVVAVGNIAPVKGYGDLIDALAMLRQNQRVPSPRLLIAGGLRQPESSRLQARANALGLEHAVTFLGEFRDLSLLFAVASVYVSASHQEGFSLTTVEAMAAGVPVVVTDSGGPAEIVDSGRCGRVVPVAQPAALANGINSAIVDPKLTRTMVSAATEQVAAEYTAARMTARYLELYREITADK